MTVTNKGPYELDHYQDCKNFPEVHGDICDQSLKFRHSYLGRGISTQDWDYFAAVISLPLFTTYSESKTTLLNRLMTHRSFHDLYSGSLRTFEQALEFFNNAKSVKSETFVPPAQIHALIQPCEAQNVAEVLDALFPNNALIKKTYEKYGLYTYQEQFHPKPMNQRPAGRVLHAKLMDKLSAFRNQEVSKLLTEAITMLFALRFFTASKRVFSAGKVCYRTYQVKAKFELIFNASETPFTTAGRWEPRQSHYNH